MKRLSLISKREEKEEMKFEEFLTSDGKWNIAGSTPKDFPEVRLLNYCSSEYEFFVVEDENGNHLIYRCKKK